MALLTHFANVDAAIDYLETNGFTRIDSCTWISADNTMCAQVQHRRDGVTLDYIA